MEKKNEIKAVGLRGCQKNFVKVCMSDIEGLNAYAVALWPLLCHKWDLAKHKYRNSEEKNGWVTISQKYAAEYGIRRYALESALVDLEAKGRVIVKRRKNRAVRVKIRTWKF